MDNSCVAGISGATSTEINDCRSTFSSTGRSECSIESSQFSESFNQRMNGASKDTEGGLPWIVTFAAFMFYFLVDGISLSFGVFYVELLEMFNSSSWATSWIVSVMLGTYLFVGPLVGALVNRFGCRTVASAGSFVAAIALFACTYAPSIESMIIVYGFVGDVTLEDAEDAKPKTEENKTGFCRFLPTFNVDLLRSPSFVLFGIFKCLTIFGYFTPFAFLPAFGQSKGFSSQKSSLLVSTIGIASTIFVLISGWVSDQTWANPIFIYSVAAFVGGVVTVLVPFCPSYLTLILYCIMLVTA
ncbi:MOT14-like protein [Mya arenaria]|uniref:MOT14-like protein n=1 Tax=Mya arenaria TaxID=6604 RepID=A0ABY7DWP7_MYAAR|nr:MOT14-like protein [Mya arenaria]